MKWLMVLLVLWTPMTAIAAVDPYTFADPAQEQRFQDLTQQLRCPKCQNENIHDSGAPIAADMRRRVYRMMQQGASNQEIKNALVQRFGEFVLYRPPVERRTYILWYGPALVVALGLFTVLWLARRRRTGPAGPDALSDSEQDRLRHLLEEDQARH